MRTVHLILPLALALGTSVAPFIAQAQVALDVSITAAPPELPEYDQPPLPALGDIFMPGYWAYGYSGYYWVPGTWVEPPQPNLLWTPGYWGWNGGRYIFNTGYWGPSVGYYGGINYGFGYGGLGYEGGYWRGGSFFYNSKVNNFGGVRVTNVFERNVTNVTVNRYSFNGPNGVNRQPTPGELAAARAPHVPPTAMQMQHVQAAQQNRSLLASVNRGHPAVLVTPRPAAFGGGRTVSVGIHGATPAPSPHPIVHGTPTGRPYNVAPHSTAPHMSAPAPRRPSEARSYAPATTATPRPTPRPSPAPEARPMAPMHSPTAAHPMAARPPAGPAPRPSPTSREEKPKG